MIIAEISMQSIARSCKSFSTFALNPTYLNGVMSGVKRITIHDIARSLGVSASTVSRALQNSSRISTSVRKAVRAEAERLNYLPNAVASQLRTGKGKSLGVIVPRIDRHFFASVIGGIERVAMEAGYMPVICQSDESFEKEQAAVEALIRKKIDGIAVSLAAATHDTQHFEKLRAAGIPVVFFDRVPLNFRSSCVTTNDFLGAYRTVNHLIDQGCTRIAHFGGPLHISVYKNRYEGYCAALADRGLSPDSALLIRNAITFETGEKAAYALCNLALKPDGLFSSGDFAALAALQVFKREKIAVPAQVCVAGFANELFDAYIEPGLTSVDQQGRRMGEEVAKRLISEMLYPTEGPGIAVVLEPELIIRGSSLRNRPE